MAVAPISGGARDQRRCPRSAAVPAISGGGPDRRRRPRSAPWGGPAPARVSLPPLL